MTFYKKHDIHKVDFIPDYPYDYKRGMPLIDGYYMGLSYVPKHRLPAHLAEWRTWMKAHPKNEWPKHVTDYAEALKRSGQKSALLAEHLE